MTTDVVGRSRYGDRSGTAHVGVAQLVRQLLQLISFKPVGGKVRLEPDCRAVMQSQPVVIPENVVVSWSGGSLDSLVGAQIEVELCRMRDPNIHRGSGRNVPALSALFLLVSAEQSGEREKHY